MRKINCVIFDWAGTTVDYGCFAPVEAFIKAFETININLTLEEARGPMGMTKIDHIRELFKLEKVSRQFTSNFNHNWTESDVIDLNKIFEKFLFASLENFTTPIEGVKDVIEKLRNHNYKIGSTSGYTDDMMKIVAKGAAEKGYSPDCWVTSNNLPAGRPAPYMIYRNMEILGVKSVNEVLKIGDTIADIKEGVNAGVCSVGIVLGSSEMGLSKDEELKLDPYVLLQRKENVRRKMMEAGADYVIDTINELPELIKNINSGKAGTLKRPYLLLTPGPLTTTDRVKKAMLADWCTWDADYNEGIVQKIRKGLLDVACVDESDYTSVLLQGSGSYCVESAITCNIGKNDKVLIIANGAYGERMVKIAQYANLNYSAVILKETQVVTPKLVEEELAKDKDITHVSLVHSETTTGILNPIQQIAKCVKDAGKIIIVDAMSSFGGVPIDMKAWDIDILISSANKCIQGVPGFGFVIIKKNLIEKAKGNSKSLSLDLYEQWLCMEKGKGKWRFTSPTHVVRAFKEALDEFNEEGGVKIRYNRYKKNQNILSKGMSDLGFKPLLPQDIQSPIITSFLYPNSDFCFSKFYEELKERGFVLYPGKISECDTFRIGNIGDIYPEDILKLIETVKIVIRK